MRRPFALMVGCALTALLHQGCACEDIGTLKLNPLFGDGGCFLCGPVDCPSPGTEPKGPVHGKRSDGRVDVTAAEAWPDRPNSEPPLSTRDIAEACAAFALCTDWPRSDYATQNDSDRTLIQHACVHGSLRIAGQVSAAERVIPLFSEWGSTQLGNQFEETFPVFARRVLAAHGDCAKIDSALTKTLGFSCQEDGCWSPHTPKVTCDGDVATLTGISDSGPVRRDCSLAGAHCSTSSPTGCTDRQLVRCESGAKDRCDGSIKLGCDGCGFVSYHDCSWNGGTCAESDGGAACVPPGTGCSTVSTSCTGGQLSLCVGSDIVTLNCETSGTLACHDVGGAIVEDPPITHALCMPTHAAQTDAGAPDGASLGDAGASDAGAPRSDASSP